MIVKKLLIPEIISEASQLASVGKLAVSDNLIYLDIDDRYIHRLFPLLQNQQIKKPDYFCKESIGAHISVIYPGENQAINKEDLDLEHNFIIKDIVRVQLGLKTYFALLVEAPTLLQLRRSYGLADDLVYKGHSIGFHITIGVKSGDNMIKSAS